MIDAALITKSQRGENLQSIDDINENENIQTAETKLNQLHQLLDAYLN